MHDRRGASRGRAPCPAHRLRARAEGCRPHRTRQLRAVPAADRLQDRAEHAQRARARNALPAAVLDRRRHRGAAAVRLAGDRAVARAPRAQPRARASHHHRADQRGDELVHAVRARLRGRLPDPHHGVPAAGRAEVDRQFRHPDPDLCDARMGAEHRGRARRPARPRLRGVLRGRLLYLCAARQGVRLLVLDPAAARRLPLGFLGRPARLPGAAPARRLSGDRHIGLRRDHPPHPDQLGVVHRRLRRRERDPAPDGVRHSVQRQRRGVRGGRHQYAAHHRRVGRRRRGKLLDELHDRAQSDLPAPVPLLRDPRARAAHRLCDDPFAPAARRARLGGVARGRDRVPLARHQHHQHQAHGLRDGRDVRGLRRLVLRRATGFHLAGILHVPRIGHHPGDRRARRHGQPGRRRGRGGRS